MDLSQGLYFSLNPVAVEIWEAIDGELEPAVAIEDLADRFDVSPELMARDCAAFVTELEGRGLLHG